MRSESVLKTDPFLPIHRCPLSAMEEKDPLSVIPAKAGIQKVVIAFFLSKPPVVLADSPYSEDLPNRRQ